MNGEQIVLDRGLHELLKRWGYEFLLITDVHFNDEKKISAITVNAKKEIPGGTVHSCTGIDDPMITTFIFRPEPDCSIFIEPFEEFSN